MNIILLICLKIDYEAEAYVAYVLDNVISFALSPFLLFTTTIKVRFIFYRFPFTLHFNLLPSLMFA